MCSSHTPGNTVVCRKFDSDLPVSLSFTTQLESRSTRM